MQEKKAGGRFEAERKITTSDGEGTFENDGARGMRETMTEALDCGGSYHLRHHDAISRHHAALTSGTA